MPDDKLTGLLLGRMNPVQREGPQTPLKQIPYKDEDALTRFMGGFMGDGLGLPVGDTTGGGVAGTVGAGMGMFGPGKLFKALKGLKPGAAAASEAGHGVRTAMPAGAMNEFLPVGEEAVSKFHVGTPPSVPSMNRKVPSPATQQVSPTAVRPTLPPAGLDPTPDQLREMGKGMEAMLDPNNPVEAKMLKALQSINKSHPHVMGKVGNLNFDPRYNQTLGAFELEGSKQFPALVQDIMAYEVNPSEISPDIAKFFKTGTVHVNPYTNKTAGDMANTMAHEATHAMQANKLGPQYLKDYSDETILNGYNLNKFERSANKVGAKAEHRVAGRPPLSKPNIGTSKSTEEMYQMIKQLQDSIKAGK